MQTFLTLLLIAAMIATLVALVRGIVIFLKTTEADLNGTGPSNSSLKSNKMLQSRIIFRALAVFIAVLIMWLANGG